MWQVKLVKRGETSIFIVNKKLREAEVKFLIEHDKKEFIYCIITLYTPLTKIWKLYKKSHIIQWGSSISEMFKKSRW